jgi:hypothetical protein
MDVRSPLAVASVVLDRPEYAAIAGGATEEVFWLLGPDAVEKVDEWARSALKPSRLSRLYPVGGYGILRDGWGPDANHAVVDCGPLGTMNCGHAHSDALAMEVSAAGCPVLVDPGTFTYTASPADRDRFRHSASHNTVTVDGQSASVPSGPFSWAIRTGARHEQWWAGSTMDWFVGSHSGFQRLPDPVTHRRSVLFVHQGYWIVVDSILAAGEHESVAHWHTAIGSEISAVSPAAARIFSPCAEGRTELFLGAVGDVNSLEWDEDWVSPSYGSRTLAPRARIVSRGRGRRDIITVLAPLGDGGPIELIELNAIEGRAVILARPGMHDLFLFGIEGKVNAAGVEGTADAALVRRSTAGGKVESVALFGAEAKLSLNGRSLHAKGGGEWSATEFPGS